MKPFNFTYDEYYEYLQSKKWAEVRNKRLLIDDYKCQMCGNKNNLQVHHLIYPAVLGSEDINDIITLCTKCHKIIEQYKKDKQYDKLTDFIYSLKKIYIRIYKKDDHNKASEYLDNNQTEQGYLTYVFVDESKSTYRTYCRFTNDEIPSLEKEFGKENVILAE